MLPASIGKYQYRCSIHVVSIGVFAKDMQLSQRRPWRGPPSQIALKLMKNAKPAKIAPMPPPKERYWQEYRSVQCRFSSRASPIREQGHLNKAVEDVSRCSKCGGGWGDVLTAEITLSTSAALGNLSMDCSATHHDASSRASSRLKDVSPYSIQTADAARTVLMASSNAEVTIPETIGGFRIRHQNDKCHTCGNKSASDALLMCSKCHWALYCDASCQKAHWEIHKRECKVLTSNPKACSGPPYTSRQMVNSDVQKLRIGFGHGFDHVREVMECIRRAGLNHTVKTLCLTQLYNAAEGTTVYIFEEPMDSKDFQNRVSWQHREHQSMLQVAIDDTDLGHPSYSRMWIARILGILFGAHASPLCDIKSRRTNPQLRHGASFPGPKSVFVTRAIGLKFRQDSAPPPPAQRQWSRGDIAPTHYDFEGAIRGSPNDLQWQPVSRTFKSSDTIFQSAAIWLQIPKQKLRDMHEQSTISSFDVLRPLSKDGTLPATSSIHSRFYIGPGTISSLINNLAPKLIPDPSKRTKSLHRTATRSHNRGISRMEKRFRGGMFSAYISVDCYSNHHHPALSIQRPSSSIRKRPIFNESALLKEYKVDDLARGFGVGFLWSLSAGSAKTLSARRLIRKGSTPDAVLQHVLPHSILYKFLPSLRAPLKPRDIDFQEFDRGSAKIERRSYTWPRSGRGNHSKNCSSSRQMRVCFFDRVHHVMEQQLYGDWFWFDPCQLGMRVIRLEPRSCSCRAAVRECQVSLFAVVSFTSLPDRKWGSSPVSRASLTPTAA
ncbi:uncharacterized protein MYCFIDRAFT_179288 [Pseudocercospora fijiensis CIRAD86]|uniref:MYND-type domain-containing protein n=1 Tax=Pseudocercospora fijiensis (strain CIRAD86) TaxID=383855 RepID=M2ZFB4_PSEFD|nr:uncharacterized protein MYCFIDRAFT_179288 [Pseudocercospora fijiensis CIRAD86]EME77804.1 hypothetical protein MYCFIDRAFT_179288 [Pseudocercospora fijiensis CIRAD86]